MGAFFNSIDEFGLHPGRQRQRQHRRPARAPAPHARAGNEARRAATCHRRRRDRARRPHRRLGKRLPGMVRLREKLPHRPISPRISISREKSLKNSRPNRRARRKLGGNKLAPGKHGNALLANGDSITTLPDLGIKHADQPFSFSLWLKPARDLSAGRRFLQHHLLRRQLFRLRAGA